MNSLFVTAYLQMTVSAFYNDNRDSDFVSRVCAFLDIPTNQMKIVGSTSGPSGEASLRTLQASQGLLGINFYIDEPTPVFQP